MPDEFEESEFTPPAPSKLPGQLSFGWDLDDDEPAPPPPAPTRVANADAAHLPDVPPTDGQTSADVKSPRRRDRRKVRKPEHDREPEREDDREHEDERDRVAKSVASKRVPRKRAAAPSTELSPESSSEPSSEPSPEPVQAAPVDAAAAALVTDVETKDQQPQRRRRGRVRIRTEDVAQPSKSPADTPAATPQNFAETMEYLPLKWGGRLPKVGFGFWKVDKERTAQICRQAIEVGYRHLDCACDYGNEVEVGQGIAAALRDGLCEREDLWVTSKLWNTYHAAEHVRPAFERSLNDLGLEYLDLYLIHFPLAQKFVPFENRYPPGWFTDPDVRNPVVEEARVSIQETWQSMEELAKEGRVKQIGVCNFTTGLLRDLLSYCHIRPTVIQVETHPQLSQQRLLRYCQQERIAYTAFSPLGAQSYFSLGMADPAESVLNNPMITEIAAAVNKTAAQVVLRWGVQRGTSVIPKTSSLERMRENINIFDFELSVDQMADIDSLDQHRRYNDPGHFGESAFNTFLPIYD